MKAAHNSPEPEALVGRSARIVYSLLKAAIRLAARFELPMQRLIELVQIAYFEEFRRQEPRDLQRVADRIGMSRRSAVALNGRLKSDFFAAENQVAPVRAVLNQLDKGPASLAELVETLPSYDAEDIGRSLVFLVESRWVRKDNGVFHRKNEITSFVDETDDRKIDGLNSQMEVLAESVWTRFVEPKVTTAASRTWVFSADPASFESFVNNAISELRHGAIDLEEATLQARAPGERFGVTISVAPVEGQE